MSDRSEYEQEVDRLLSMYMQVLADDIQSKLTKATLSLGFALVVFGQSRVQYVSNCERGEVQDALHNLLVRWKANSQRADVPFVGVGEFMNDDQEVIETPRGPIPWGTIRQALDKAQDPPPGVPDGTT